MIKFGIDGAAEMERLLKQLGPNVARRVGQKATTAGAEVIADEAKRLVPERSGDLKQSITTAPVKTRETERIKTAIGFEQPTSARAHLTEFGTQHSAAQPFVRPAMDSKAGAALDEMGRVLGKGIDREAAKLAKK